VFAGIENEAFRIIEVVEDEPRNLAGVASVVFFSPSFASALAPGRNTDSELRRTKAEFGSR